MKVPKVPKIKVVTTQPLNYLTIQLLSFFVVAEGHGGLLKIEFLVSQQQDQGVQNDKGKY